MSGLQKTIGEAVIPIFADLANSLAATGPALVAGTKVATTVFVGAWKEVTAVATMAWDVVGDVLSKLSSTFVSAFGGSETLTAMDVFTNALRLVSVAFI